MIQEFIIPISPMPWRVPPFQPGRRQSGKLYVRAGQDAELAGFQEAIREELIHQGAKMDDPPYGIWFWFWRNMDKNAQDADSTNMQKAVEDALQGVVINNDTNTRHIESNPMEQGANAPGMMLIIVKGGGEFNTPIPMHLVSRVDRMYNELTQRIHGTTFDEFKLDNTWP